MKKHKDKNDCWTIAKGVVLDITEYAKHHPGGEIIYKGAGRDCTRLFNKYHPWVKPESVIPDKVVGYVPKKKKPKKTEA